MDRREFLKATLLGGLGAQTIRAEEAQAFVGSKSDAEKIANAEDGEIIVVKNVGAIKEIRVVSLSYV